MAVYIDRLMPIMKSAFVNKTTVELVSEPGIGKSSVLRQTAQAMAKILGQPFAFVVRHLSTMDPTEVAGPLYISKRTFSVMPKDVVESTEMECAMNSYPAIFPNNSDEVFLPDGKVTTIGKLGYVPKFGAVFLDELRQAPHDVQKPAARFMDEQRIGDWSLSMFGGQYAVWAASNRSSDRSGANKDLAFITNRKMVLNVRTSHQIVINHFEQKGNLHFMCIGYIRAFPGSIFTSEVPKDDKPFPTPRSFERACLNLQTLGVDGVPAITEEAAEVAAGLMGEGRGPELIGYLRVHDDLVKIETILEDPKKARIPDRADVQWATAQMLIHHADDDNCMKLFAYAERLPREMQLPVISSISHKLPKLPYHIEYATWSARNQQLLLAAFNADRRFKNKTAA